MKNSATLKELKKAAKRLNQPLPVIQYTTKSKSQSQYVGMWQVFIYVSCSIGCRTYTAENVQKAKELFYGDLIADWEARA